MATSKANAIAEQRRLRKLENQRLADEARQKQEELRLQQERERQRIEAERIAAEQKRLYELEAIRQKKAAELAHIQKLEKAEEAVIATIERQLRLIGAFCTSEVSLPTVAPELVACVAVLSPAALEKPIPAFDASVVCTADTTGAIHVITIAERRLLFSFVLRHAESNDRIIPSSMAARRRTYVIPSACDASKGRLFVIDLRLLFQQYHTAALSNRHVYCVIDASTACVHAFGESGSSAGQFSTPRNICVDDTANEIYVSDHFNHRIQVLTMTFAVKTNSFTFSRSFGQKGCGRGDLHCPFGLDISLYHVVVCDTGNSRLAIFSKRGAFVLAVGTKGASEGQFCDLRDVRLINVRKRANTRGMPNEVGKISNEQFEIVVADSGNYRVQVLDENGCFLRQLSFLANQDQILYQRKLFGAIHADLLREYMKMKQMPPDLAGNSMTDIYALAERLHPSTPTYANITSKQALLRTDRSRFHHPQSLAFAKAEHELLVVDKDNAKLFVYNADGSRSQWNRLPIANEAGITSIHSSVCINVTINPSKTSASTTQDRLYVSDPLAHRIAVFDLTSRQFLHFIGATTYGDQEQSSNGYLTGELNHPTFLAFYTAAAPDQASLKGPATLLVSDCGNHSISAFNAATGAFIRRIGNGFGHSSGFMDSPQGISVLNNHLLFVIDQRNHRVNVFDLETFNITRSFGKQGTCPGELNFPTGVSVCPALPQTPKCNFGPHRDSKVVVADSGNARIQVFSVTGSVQLVIDVQSTPFEHLLLPLGVFVQQRSGYILVCDSANRCVIIFRNDGQYVSSFGATVEPENRFVRPVDVVIFKRMEIEQLLVCDGIRSDICSFELRDSTSRRDED
ncbi:TPA: hypothetical protein N0F65_008239 [Lagenidium giganteum]|uniref:Uncharacterized protein n=1 Tax=Lagenidium giganteum TaxID=4803 RepID=A0AAV2Z066_9STRA|nr:TPA: hypothetical protein N0F65_008239 [Lagenidium giganteum]